MHVQRLSVTFLAIDDSCDNDQLVLGHEISDAALVFFSLVLWMRLNVKLEREGER